jgi:antirestriction protein
MKVQIYVGTYAKYNNGSIEGKWIDVTDLSKEEFEQICKELHNDEEDPEYMFQDWECPRYLDNFIGESGIMDKFWDIKEEGNGLSDDDLEAFSIFVDHGHPADLRKFRDAYKGHTNSFNIERDFGYEIAEEMGYIDQMPESIRYYFDAEAFGRDLLMTDFWEEDGHIFYSFY